MEESALIEKLRVGYDRFESIPVIKMLNPLNNFDKSTPLLWIFLIGIISIVLGIIVDFLEVLFWIGGFIILIYFIYLVIWLKNQ